MHHFLHIYDATVLADLVLVLVGIKAYPMDHMALPYYGTGALRRLVNAHFLVCCHPACLREAIIKEKSQNCGLIPYLP